MGLRNLEIKSEYRSLVDNVVQDFYLPTLADASVYKRAVGYFSSSALIEITKGISKMAESGGKIRLVASPYLSQEDLEAISKGYEERNKIIERVLLDQIKSWTAPIDYFSNERLNLLASLIANNILDIKIAFTKNKNGIGMYHEKMGIIEDRNGDKVAFSGSNNETSAAMSLNYETMDVFKSWGDPSDKEHVELKEEAFSKIWNNTEKNIEVQSFPDVNKALIEKYNTGKPNYDVDYMQFGIIDRAYKYSDHLKNTETEAIGPRKPDSLNLREYQTEAITNWVGEGYRGIFDMATGTGKTLTGLSAIAKLSEDVNDNLAVIILCYRIANNSPV